MQKPKNSAFTDLKMDLGITPRNDVYFRDLSSRQDAAKAEQARLKQKRAKKNDRKNAIIDTTTETTETTGTTDGRRVQCPLPRARRFNDPFGKPPHSDN